MVEMPDRLMLDNDALNDLQDNNHRLSAVSEADIDIYVSIFQYNEFKQGLDNLSADRKEIIMSQIDQVFEKSELETTGIETSGYGEAYGYNYGGSTGEIYKELTKPDPNIGEVHRPDAVGAEAAINRDMWFVTGDGALQDKMEDCGYDEYLISLEEFRKLLDSWTGKSGTNQH